MFGLMTRRDAKQWAQNAADTAVQYAVAKMHADLQPAIDAARARVENLLRDLEISREREAEALAEVRRLREVNRIVATELVGLRGTLTTPGHTVTDDFGTEFFVFEPSQAPR